MHFRGYVGLGCGKCALIWLPGNWLFVSFRFWFWVGEWNLSLLEVWWVFWVLVTNSLVCFGVALAFRKCRIFELVFLCLSWFLTLVWVIFVFPITLFHCWKKDFIVWVPCGPHWKAPLVFFGVCLWISLLGSSLMVCSFGLGLIFISVFSFGMGVKLSLVLVSVQCPPLRRSHCSFLPLPRGGYHSVRHGTVVMPAQTNELLHEIKKT